MADVHVTTHADRTDVLGVTTAGETFVNDYVGPTTDPHLAAPGYISVDAVTLPDLEDAAAAAGLTMQDDTPAATSQTRRASRRKKR